MSSTIAHKRRGIRKQVLRMPGAIGTIGIAQLFGTSLWFSANSTAADLMRVWHATAADMGWLTSAVQIGFILGTLAISSSGAADRYPASRIFVLSAVAGAMFNGAFAWLATGLLSGAALRFCVGICLAGIYPMGMKLVVGWAPERTGQALAQLVAMLTLGTALPHAMRVAGAGFPWQLVISASSLLALLGAALISVLGDGPHTRVVSVDGLPAPTSGRAWAMFRIRAFRAATFGYFGHMWELYAFWATVPLLVSRTTLASDYPRLGVSGVAFCVIGIGALGSLIGGTLSRKLGSARVALGALALSGLCALTFAMTWRTLSPGELGVLLLMWGASVVADSPQFSALAARACPPGAVGGALAIQNSIGFAITIISISATTALFDAIGLDATWLLVPGPLLGLVGYAATIRGERQP
jgi:hypothetical protein